MVFRVLAASALLGVLAASALAQDIDPPENIPFENGTFTITQNEDFEKVLTYDGTEVARNYVLFFDKEVKVGETNVALFSVGDGGNQCGPATVIAWKKDDAIQNATVGEECGAPPASVGDSRIYFVPFLLPGETSALQYWSPDEGIRTAGDLSFTPQPNTGWDDFKPETTDSMVNAFDNAAIYEAGKALLGSDLTGVVTGLLTGGDAELQADGTVTGYGCVPHACGVSDTFMAIDPKARKLYFAQQDDPKLKAWPELGTWPAPLRTAMEAAIGPNRQN
jgi:hypothetical protein